VFVGASQQVLNSRDMPPSTTRAANNSSKKAAKVPTDVTEDRVREAALALDLVDVKVAAVDPVWSGLKLMVRKDRRRVRHAAAS
jgi:hypothetical protein